MFEEFTKFTTHLQLATLFVALPELFKGIKSGCGKLNKKSSPFLVSHWIWYTPIWDDVTSHMVVVQFREWWTIAGSTYLRVQDMLGERASTGWCHSSLAKLVYKSNNYGL